MPSPDNSRRVASIGLLILPLVVVKIASAVLARGAPRSSAASAAASESDAATNDAATAATAPPVEWTLEQRAAAEQVRQLASSAFGPTPMLHAAAPIVATPVEAPPPEVPVSRIPEPPHFVLQAVMAAVTGDMAIINGRMYSAGQTVVGTNWQVQAIDVPGRTAILFDTEFDRTATIIVQTPD